MYGIPEFRLPKAIVQKEIDTLKDLGVEFVLNFVVGRSETIDELFGDGYRGDFRRLRRRSADLHRRPGRERERRLLRERVPDPHQSDEGVQARTPTPRSTTRKKVAVVGGGNVAMDAARCAKRMGADEVYIVYRRSEKELPARLEEESTTRRKRASCFKFLTAPLEVLADENFNVTGLKCQQMELGEPDASGRRRPIPVDGQRVCDRSGLRYRGDRHQPEPADPSHRPRAWTPTARAASWLMTSTASPPRTAYSPAATPLPARLPLSSQWAQARRAAAAMDEYIKNKNK